MRTAPKASDRFTPQRGARSSTVVAVGPALCADERDEHHAAEVVFAPFGVAASLDEDEPLRAEAARDRNDKAAADGELLAQRLWNARPRRRDDGR